MRKGIRVNERIFAKTVRLIGPNGEQLGIFPRDLALRKAEEFDLDLVEVAPQADPPVCRIMDFAKYKYEQEKKEREAKRHHRHAQLKEIRLSPRIDNHDYQIKLKHIQEFLEKGHKVRVRMFFRGREVAHQEIGRKLIDRLITDVEKLGKVEREPHLLGRALILVLGPK
ncbi:MAG: translation initiation factor IF-3 [Candidatus Omnitrophota bacterium]|nr:translation initiation factor IF-3 [Candidatus Omnitrophota bacterium]RKY31749.1 MAG: translation initiation factor IF-3 [Candidatus Omnitrophota bacterium]HDN85946.1 translation initiation factor IF-3 [Candidatus Omnitrophota bacterium]